MTSKDYTIFKIRYYADGINVRKGIFNGDDIEHHQRAKEYNNFFWQMVEKATGHPLKYWATKYFLSSRECATEELHDLHDIYIPESEEYYYWFIPIYMTELTEWIQSNCKLPFKIVKRSTYSSCLNNDKTNWRRMDAEAFTKKHLPTA